MNIHKYHASLTPLERKKGKLPLLKEADIVFVRHKKSFVRFLLRKITKSYWDHTALIIYPQNKTKKRCHSILVESNRNGWFSLLLSRGISVHKLDRYLYSPKKFDIGIKRVPLSPDRRDRVVTHMLANIDAPYWPWNYGYALLAFMFPPLRRRFLTRQRFSCSAFVQTAFFSAQEWKKKKDVIFKSGSPSPIEFQQIITPGDIAKSNKSQWIYNQH